jgi:hypothetical protein
MAYWQDGINDVCSYYCCGGNRIASNYGNGIKPQTLFTRTQEDVKNRTKALTSEMAPDSFSWEESIEMGRLPLA